jgi:hypothetical protein
MLRIPMTQEYRVDVFLFLYDLEPSEFCTNFRFDSGSVFTYGSPVRELSFSVWKNMLTIGYSIHKGKESFEVAAPEANYFAAAIVACYSFLTMKLLEHSLRNWVEFEMSSPASKIVAGTLTASDPPITHADNDTLKEAARLMPLILNNPPLARALDDFYSCLSRNNPDFYVFAYRAVEDIRSHYDPTPDEKSREKGWNVMNKALGRKKEDYEELFVLSTQGRHKNLLGEEVNAESVDKWLKFVSSLIRDFIRNLSSG